MEGLAGIAILDVAGVVVMKVEIGLDVGLGGPGVEVEDVVSGLLGERVEVLGEVEVQGQERLVGVGERVHGAGIGGTIPSIWRS